MLYCVVFVVCNSLRTKQTDELCAVSTDEGEMWVSLKDVAIFESKGFELSKEEERLQALCCCLQGIKGQYNASAVCTHRQSNSERFVLHGNWKANASEKMHMMVRM